VPGGAERQDSVAAGFAAAEAFAPEIVFIHDGVRPFLDPEILRAVHAAAKRHGAAIPVVPVTDTLKRVSAAGVITETVPNKGLYRAQTPQAFRREILRAALEKAGKEGAYGTDESSLVERLGKTVETVKGSGLNLKITTPDDLAMAKILIKEGILPAPRD
jgi:2-C-methyl-D-erythritol 4-phosphate cytidylyltransferase